jgi:hypothetical protein
MKKKSKSIGDTRARTWVSRSQRQSESRVITTTLYRLGIVLNKVAYHGIRAIITNYPMVVLSELGDLAKGAPIQLIFSVTFVEGPQLTLTTR